MDIVVLSVVTAVCVLAMVVAEERGARVAFGVSKTVGALAFVTAGALWLPMSRDAGRVLLVGLVLALVGDVLLIPKGRGLPFLLGLGSFLCAHIAYAVAFALLGVDVKVVALVALLALVPATVVMRRLWPRTGSLRAPVAGYIVAISIMVTLAVGAWAHGASTRLPVGALLFYLSDLAVARERFLSPGPWNARFGLPLYFAAQLVLASCLLP